MLARMVTVLVEATDEIAAKALEDNFQCRLGCLEDAQTDCVEVLEAALWDEVDRFVVTAGPLGDGMLLLDRPEP